MLDLPRAPMATMDMLLTRARLTVTTDLVIFPAVYSSVLARGSTADFTAAQASMVAADSMVTAASTAVPELEYAVEQASAGVDRLVGFTAER